MSQAQLRIDAANAEVWRRIVAGRPRLVDLRPAREVVPGLGERTVLHAGPPLAGPHEISGALRGTVIGAALYEGWAETSEAAARLLDAGAIELASAHEHGALGTYAGGISPSAPVFVVRNEAFGNLAYNNLNEGRGQALRYGCYDAATLGRLRWLERVLAPLLADAIRAAGGFDLLPIIAQALHMGDECHSRHKAASALFVNQLAPYVAAGADPAARRAEALAWLAANEIFFLNLTMPACKAILDAAAGVPGASVVTCMARNGARFGIRISAFPDRWFTAPVAPVEGAYFEGYGPADANPDLGDSAITETLGLGAFALAAAPALARYMGVAPGEVAQFTERMYPLVLGEHPDLTIPALGYRGVPTGIDVRRVATSGVTPVTNSGLAHRAGGIGQIGAGYVWTPLACYEAAAAALETQDFG
ncbi:MAG TPA: DUF1116 domain-containing protein [Chloroflexota bacterium]|nr:DUF1116 domain-containing protein [Chloroflexota bacterium]